MGNCIFFMRFILICLLRLVFPSHVIWDLYFICMELTYALAMYNARNVNRKYIGKQKSLLHRIINILRLVRSSADRSQVKWDRCNIDAIASIQFSTGGQRHNYKANGHSLGWVQGSLNERFVYCWWCCCFIAFLAYTNNARTHASDNDLATIIHHGFCMLFRSRSFFRCHCRYVHVFVSVPFIRSLSRLWWTTAERAKRARGNFIPNLNHTLEPIHLIPDSFLARLANKTDRSNNNADNIE